MSVRVVNVRGLRTREGRSAVCYVGRRCAGWPQSEWHNPFRVGDTSPNNFRVKLDAAHALELFGAVVESKREAGTLDKWLADLWEACGRGAKSLGCWCTESTAGDGSPVVCHAQTLAGLLQERYGGAA